MAEQAAVAGVQFPELQPTPREENAIHNIGLMMDVMVPLSVELGRTKKTIKDVLTLGEGSVIELDKLNAEPVDILVNGKLIAKGEVVTIDTNFGVRITQIMSPEKRLGEV